MGLKGTSSGTSKDSTSYASSSSNSGESRGRTQARDSGKRGRSRDKPTRPVKRGYHTFTALGREFCVEKRWKLVRELGSGAYGLVVSVQDEITGETIAIKLITRVFDKLQLAKRALREITLLRHFNNHDNITGLIDMDVVGPDFNEIYLFMEPMEADLYQIIRSGQVLTDAHVRYFTYQILRGIKFIHSADVIHRDLKPGNLLVNSDCELKICDLGLSRGYNSKAREDEPSNLTEYVATRWYRAPEIMLSFRRYDTAIDMWSIGCILGELLSGKPVFKGKDYVDQLNLILNTLGTPSEESIRRIGSEKARAYIRSLPYKKPIPFSKLLPNADPHAVDLLSKLLTFDPADRLNVNQALEHPFLAAYHDLDDEPENPEKFEKWREVEKHETTEQYRAALLKEVLEFRQEVRSIGAEAAAMSNGSAPQASSAESADHLEETVEPAQRPTSPTNGLFGPLTPPPAASVPFPASPRETDQPGAMPPPSSFSKFIDPYRTYARRTSLLSTERGAETAAALGSSTSQRALERAESTAAVTQVGATASYIVPARSRAPSDLGDSAPQLLRQLSTKSITRSAAGADAKGAGPENGVNLDMVKSTAADAPPSTIPPEWARKTTQIVATTGGEQ